MLSVVNEQVTIVIPVRDRARLILRCLDSVASQTALPARVIVVDNGSTDGTPGAVSAWKESHVDCGFRLDLLAEPKPGASAARNRGLREVDTEYVMFFDSDDEMLPGLIETAMKSVSDSDIVYWRAEVVGLDGKIYKKPFHRDSLVRRQFYNGMLATQIYMVRTALVREAGGWEEHAAVWNDWELGIRLVLASPKCKAIDRTLVRIHAQEQSITGKAFSHRVGSWENTLDIIDRKLKNSGRSIREKARLHRMVVYRRVILAAHYRREGAPEESAKLMRATFEDVSLSASDRVRLRLIYRYTAAGGRGAYYLWK